MQSRYYDPAVKRFLNADSYASTGDGYLGYNMFAYCGNNPVNCSDPTGDFWVEIWEFVKEVFCGTGSAMASLSPAYAGCGSLAAVDGPLPVGDIIGLVGIGFLTIGSLGYGIYQAVDAPSTAASAGNVKEKEKAVVEDNKRQAYFPSDPNMFMPMGLVRTDYPGTGNGIIIKWSVPLVRNAVIFEWDEDYNYGPHYHVMLPGDNGRHDGQHYYAGEPVPEPWNTLYFGG